MVAITLNPTENSLSVTRSDENMSYLPRSQEELGCLSQVEERETLCDPSSIWIPGAMSGGRVAEYTVGARFSTGLTRCLDVENRNCIKVL